MTLILENLTHVYGNLQTLKGLSLSVEPGEVVSLLGPSGCGKTTLLRLIAGLEQIESGRILLNEETLATSDVHPPPEKRPVGLVFQEHALFPNMTVAENIEFGLKQQPKAERHRRCKDLLHMIGLDGFESRKPGTLSGGQQQRVALARALAPAPAVMLLDEPYASVDVILRRSLRDAARLLLKEAGSATVLVTHDPDEALEMSDRIAVMSEGRILQVGTPDEIINLPSQADVATLFGEAQNFAGEIRNGNFVYSEGEIALGPQAERVSGAGEVDLVIRPSGIGFTANPEGSWRVRDIRHRSSGKVLTVSSAERDTTNVIRVGAENMMLPEVGTRGDLTLKETHAFIFLKS
tara:strand:+ start:24208 stop:25257 length:1050 start_codon:yes stop_codon:yes gene_type:complete